MQKPILQRKQQRSVSAHTLALTPELWEAIERLAVQRQVSKSDVARYLLALGLQQHPQQKDQ